MHCIGNCAQVTVDMAHVLHSSNASVINCMFLKSDFSQVDSMLLEVTTHFLSEICIFINLVVSHIFGIPDASFVLTFIERYTVIYIKQTYISCMLTGGVVFNASRHLTVSLESFTESALRKFLISAFIQIVVHIPL